MKFIRKNILTAVFFSVFAILLGGALISCSNGSSSSDEDDDESSYGTKIYSESVTFNAETPTQIVSAETLSDLSIKSLTIKVINVNYSGSDDWWFTACSDASWSNEAKLEWQSGEGANSLYLATITDAAAIAAYKANGIYIAGTNSATASVSVFYVEGEAEESNASSGSGSQTENNGNSSSENESNGNSDGNTSSGNETTGTSSNGNEDNGSSSEMYICSEQSFSNSDSENSAFLQILSSDKFSNLDISTIKIIVKLSSAQDDGWWACASATDSWNDETSVSLTWNDTYSGYSKEITTQSFISALKINGLYIQVSKSAAGTVTVSYE